jgi:membrane fusion protein (multidrug efflux system)
MPRRSVALAIAFGAALLISGCGKAPETPAAAGGPGAGAGGPPPALPVTVVVAKTQRIPDVIESVGQTEGSKDIEVRSRVSGIIESQLYREGDRIKAGTPMFQIERAPFENALAQAQASLAQERARLDQTRREGGRLKGLVEERAISRREYEDATTNVLTSEAAIAAAQARVKDAQLNLSYTTINAPIGGITGRALRSIGSLVTAGTESALLTTISQQDPIWVRFSVDEGGYRQVREAKRTEARLVLGDGTVYPQQGRINFTSSSVDQKLGTIQLRAEFPNAALALLPGQFVRVRLTAGESEAILIPQSAVVQNDQGRFAWVAGADGKAVLKPIEATSWQGRDWAIRKGLAPGDQVIVDNLLKLRPGAPVQAKQAGAQQQVPSGAMPLPSLKSGTPVAGGGGGSASGSGNASGSATGSGSASRSGSGSPVGSGGSGGSGGTGSTGGTPAPAAPSK